MGKRRCFAESLLTVDVIVECWGGDTGSIVESYEIL
jgi:hypothetical protein